MSMSDARRYAVWPHLRSRSRSLWSQKSGHFQKLSPPPFEWRESIKYLGVYLHRGSSIKFDINPTKRAFYAACNTIFLHGSGADEIALLNLQETFSLSVIMYAMPALHLTTRQINELNACWNNVIRRLFGFNNWESVSAMLLGLGRLNIYHIIMLCKVTFYRLLLYSCDVFYVRCF